MLENKIKQFRAHQKQMNALHLALATMNYDAETIAPKKGNKYRNELMSVLATNTFRLKQDPTYYGLVKDINQETTDTDLKRETDLILKALDKYKEVDETLYGQLNLATINANDTWKEAKEANDYSMFEPTLKELISLSKKVASKAQGQYDTLYDVMLDDYDEGNTQEKVETFFKVIQERLVPFIKKMHEKNIEKPEFLSRPVSIENQKKITAFIADYLGFDKSFSVIAETEHPFSSTLSINDTRITTHYHEDLFTSNIFSIIHEMGHSFYNHQVDKKYEGTVIADAMGMSMHESQSRFLENNIGRSKAFWKPIYPQLKELASEALYDVDLDEFIRGINYPELSLIRIEADELTYPIHVLVRYKLEQEMILNGNLDNLDLKWADAYEEYLGIRPQTASEGILQDVHWSGASFGYFPTYAIGSAIAAQFHHTLNNQVNLEEKLENQEIDFLKNWLRENIHQYGGFLTKDEVIEKVCNEPFDPNYYCDYLIEKFSTLFDIK